MSYRLLFCSMVLIFTFTGCGKDSSGGKPPAQSKDSSGGKPPAQSKDSFFDEAIRSFEFDASANQCNISSPPSELNLAPFYKKYCSLFGVPVVSSGAVSDEALKRVWFLASEMVGTRTDYLETLAKAGIVIAIIGKKERTTQIPEYSDLDPWWDGRARGFGATWERPAVSAAEENIMCLSDDIYVGENIFVHEFAHTLHEFSIDRYDSNFEDTLEGLYKYAEKNLQSQDTREEDITTANYAKYGKGAYSMDNPIEYWAEGVQSYYNVDKFYPKNSSDLNETDPEIYKLIENYLKDNNQSRVDRCPKK